MEVHCLSNIKEVADVLFATKNGSREEAKSVVELTIRHNVLTKLEGKLGVENAEMLDLAFNGITQLGNGVFSELQMMETLTLSHNNIEELQPEAFLVKLLY